MINSKEYLIEFDENETVDQLVFRINKIEGLPLKELKVSDLVFDNGN